MSSYFISATGTGIGKTFVTCALLHAAREKNLQVAAYKPVISGWDGSEETDTHALRAAGGDQHSIDAISPWRFTAPLSPHRAAAQEGKSLVLEDIVHYSQQQMAKPGVTLIEGVGGVMVPLTDRHTTLDWMRALAVPVVLVTGSYLGAISHTLSALAVLEHAGLRVAALVMSESEGASVNFAEAQAGLAPFISTIPLRIFQPRVSSYRQATHIANLLRHF